MDPKDLDLNQLGQWSGRLLGITSWDPSVCKSNMLHVDIHRFFLYKIGVYSTDYSKMIGDFLQSWTSTGYHSNSTGSFVTNCRFFPIIDTCVCVCVCVRERERESLIFSKMIWLLVWSLELEPISSQTQGLIIRSLLVPSVTIIVWRVVEQHLFLNIIPGNFTARRWRKIWCDGCVNRSVSGGCAPSGPCIEEVVTLNSTVDMAGGRPQIHPPWTALPCFPLSCMREQWFLI